MFEQVKRTGWKVDIVLVDGKISADGAAMLIIKVKRVNSNIKPIVLAEDLLQDETDKTRVLEYGADEFTVKPVSAESIIDKVYSSLLTREHK
jgi:DNA-binding response OmpR family regulator